jgi:hypothetical protein
VAGPVVVPKIFDGRNKLFFMINYEDYAEKWPQKLALSVPAPEFLDGDFSKLVDNQGRQIAIYDPLTATTSNPTRTQFPGNRIPADRLNPIAKKILGFYGKANTSDLGKSYSESNYVNGENFATDDFYNLVFKFDTNLGDKDRLFFRHASNDRTEHRNENGTFGVAECCQLPFQRINDHVTADWVRTLSPRLILNVRASYNRFIERGRSDEGEAFDPASLGWPASFVNQLPNSASVKYFPKIQLRGAFNYADLGRYPGGNITNTYAVHPNANWILGSHALKFGLDYRFTQFSTQDVGDILRLQSTRRWTRQRWDQDDALSGNPVADFMLGMLDSGEVNWRQLPIYGNNYVAPYFQDDWKVSRRLTLNLGLRWDVNAPPRERFDRGNYIFDPAGVPAYAAGIDTTNLVVAKQIKGGLTFLGGSNPVMPAKTDWNNFQPRFGLAYQVRDKIVARLGWGVYYVNPNDNWHNGDVRQGFDLTTPLVRSNDGDRTPIGVMLNNPFPSVLRPAGASAGLSTFLNRDITYFDPTFVVPYVHQFSAGFQVELPYSSVVELSYAGNRTVNLQSEWDGYNSPSAAFRKLCNPFEGGDPNYCNETVANPFKGVEAFRGTGMFTANTISRWQANRPYPQFNRIRQRGINPGAIWYNAFQVQHQTRFSGGINVLSTYTFSKQVERWGYTDQINKIPQQGLYTQDRPHRFTLAGVWKLPFGKGRKWGAGAGPIAERLIGGWEVTGFLQIQSGRPWDLPGETMILGDPQLKINDWLANKVQGVSNCVWRYQNAQRAFVRQPWVDSSCTQPVFMQAPSFTEGRINPFRSGQIRLHTSPNLDASVNKTTRITERFSFQFRLEAFNATNTYFWGRNNFTNDPNNQNFGAYFPKDATDQNRYPRQVQMGLKLIF